MLDLFLIIDHMTELNAFLPANLKGFHIFVQKISSFKVIPTDKIFEWIRLSNFTSYNKFLSLGPLFLVWLFFVAILLSLGFKLERKKLVHASFLYFVIVEWL